MKCFVVTLRSALDDTIVGAYATESEARGRMAEVAAEVLSQEPKPGVSEPVAVAIYTADGPAVAMLDQVEFDDGPQADAIREFCRGLGWNGQ